MTSSSKTSSENIKDQKSIFKEENISGKPENLPVKNVKWYKKTFPKEFFKQWWLGAIYVVATGGCMYMASNTTSNAKVSIAWLFATIVSMQITTDLYDFSNKQHKGYFTAVLRFISAMLALLVAYNIKN
ncbi:hypothetical protein ACN5PR_000598 [Cronobacter dublinensis]